MTAYPSHGTVLVYEARNTKCGRGPRHTIQCTRARVLSSRSAQYGIFFSEWRAKRASFVALLPSLSGTKDENVYIRNTWYFRKIQRVSREKVMVIYGIVGA